MNYIDRINDFWIAHEANQFSPTEIALYFYLLKIANICHWPDSFERNNAKIIVDLSVSFKTLAKARNRLKQTGMIDFRTKNGSPNVKYSFDRLPDERKPKPAPTVDSSSDTPEEETPKEPTPKPTPPQPKKKTSEADMLISKDNPFYDAFSEWLKYKRERKESYKSQRALKAALSKLQNYSNKDPVIAMEIIKESMSNNWAGFFPLKDNRNGRSYDKTNGKRDPMERENFAEKEYSGSFYD